jgi:hypothetical protein
MDQGTSSKRARSTEVLSDALQQDDFEDAEKVLAVYQSSPKRLRIWIWIQQVELRHIKYVLMMWSIVLD